jgi:ceramidase
MNPDIFTGGMSRQRKIWLLITLTVVAVAAVLSIGTIPQAQAYHHFCDQRTFWGIPNFANVVSNLSFCVVGAVGLYWVRHSIAARGLKVIYYVVFTGVFFTGLGSAYYHLRPEDATLVYDRLPITIVFMGMAAAAMEEGIGSGVGAVALWPLVGFGLVSVWWWQFTETTGPGDLRLYVLAQYYPLLFIPTVLLLFNGPRVRRGWGPLLFCFGCYGLAKLAETVDCSIYSFLGGLSGHTVKHLLAATATGSLVVRFRLMQTSIF